MSPKLSIIIPTFNRNSILLDNLKLLLPQLNAECKIIILDNCSDTPVSYTLKDIQIQYSVTIDIITNKVNIGANANIVRCFELCATDWLWILGDDDQPHLDCIQTILENISIYEESVFINFSSEIKSRQELFTTSKQDEFIELMDSWSNVLFISSGIYKASVLRKHLRVAYHYIYSMGPHFALLLETLHREENAHCVFSDKSIVTWVAPSSEQSWDYLILCNATSLLELVPNETSQRKLAEEIIGYIPSIKYLSLNLLDTSSSYNSDTNYYYHQLAYKIFYFSKNSLKFGFQYIYFTFIRVHIKKIYNRIFYGNKKRDILPKRSLRRIFFGSRI